MKALLTEREVESIYSIKIRTLQKWRWQGGGPPYYKLGRAVRYKPADIERYIEARKCMSTSDRVRADT